MSEIELKELEEDMEETPDYDFEFDFSDFDISDLYPPEERELRKIFVSKQTLASLLGLSTRRIEQLVEEGIIDPPEGKRPKKYNLFRSVQLYLKFLRYGKDYV